MIHVRARLAISTLTLMLLAGCSSTYYNAMEKVGVHKRDIMVSRVEEARDAQKDAQKEFKDALHQFGSVIKIQETDLKKAYEQLNAEYEDSQDAADEVSDRIKSVEAVSDALFSEWAAEIKEYGNAEYRRTSQQQLRDTKVRYGEMLASMKSAERSMQPVLKTLKDNVLFLKHNLNAQAVGALRGEFSTLNNDIANLVSSMNRSIASSNEFISKMQKQ